MKSQAGVPFNEFPGKSAIARDIFVCAGSIPVPGTSQLLQNEP